MIFCLFFCVFVCVGGFCLCVCLFVRPFGRLAFVRLSRVCMVACASEFV